MKKILTITLAAMLALCGVALAGSLEPSGPPAPTMKTLDQIPPTWSLILPGAQRFQLLSDMNNYAVLDKETGLVWTNGIQTSGGWWEFSRDECRKFKATGRMGWRLPTIEELSSLLEAPFPYTSASLPSGHPFDTNVLWAPVRSATNSPSSPSQKLKLDLNTGEISSEDLTTVGNAMCVRGGAGFEN
jgi:hypothetical protein